MNIVGISLGARYSLDDFTVANRIINNKVEITLGSLEDTEDTNDIQSMIMSKIDEIMGSELNGEESSDGVEKGVKNEVKNEVDALDSSSIGRNVSADDEKFKHEKDIDVKMSKVCKERGIFTDNREKEVADVKILDAEDKFSDDDEDEAIDEYMDCIDEEVNEPDEDTVASEIFSSYIVDDIHENKDTHTENISVTPTVAYSDCKDMVDDSAEKSKYDNSIVVTPSQPIEKKVKYEDNIVVSPSKPIVSPSKPIVSPSKPIVSPSKPIVSPIKPIVSPSKPIDNKHSYSDYQSNSIKKENIICSKQSTVSNNIHKIESESIDYSKMSSKELFNGYVKKYLIDRGICKKPVPVSEVVTKFGQVNVAKLLKGCYIIKIGSNIILG